jgi:hypothetical protein
MRRLMLILVLFIFLFVPVLVSAQGKVHYSLVGVDIWPEYDQPAVLVIYRLTLAPDTVLPTKLMVRIPSSARINAVAIMNSANRLVDAPYKNAVQGQWSEIELTATTLQAQVEFYVPLVRNDSARHIVFEWSSENPVDRLDANFLRPFGAESVFLSLSPTDTGPGQDGLTNYHVRANDLMAGQPFTLTIDYRRNTEDLSISSLPVQAASTPGLDTPGRVSMTGILPWVLAVIGVLLIVGGMIGFIIWQRGGQGTSTGRKQAMHPKENKDDNIYCPECGKRAKAGDVFCRTCGTRLRI